MGEQTINIGSAPNDGTGDTVRDAFDKVNDNLNTLQSGTVALVASVWKAVVFTSAFSDANYQLNVAGWDSDGNPVAIRRRNKTASGVELRAAANCDCEYIAKEK